VRAVTADSRPVCNLRVAEGLSLRLGPDRRDARGTARVLKQMYLESKWRSGRFCHSLLLLSRRVLAPSRAMSYSIPDLIELLKTERGDRVLLNVGSPPTLIVKGELHAIEGPPAVQESVDEMLRTVANSRQMRAFRESGIVDVIVPFEGSRFLVRAVRAFGECRLELQPITV
jgi:hypothetical protein